MVWFFVTQPDAQWISEWGNQPGHAGLGQFRGDIKRGAGQKSGALNPRLYPLANTDAFHNAASIGSDFAHVGLGSPNMNALDLELLGPSPGTPSATSSTSQPVAQIPASGDLSSTVPADGKTQGFVVVTLWDAKGNTVSGKNVTLGLEPGQQRLD